MGGARSRTLTPRRLAPDSRLPTTQTKCGPRSTTPAIRTARGRRATLVSHARTPCDHSRRAFSSACRDRRLRAKGPRRRRAFALCWPRRTHGRARRREQQSSSAVEQQKESRSRLSLGSSALPFFRSSALLLLALRPLLPHRSPPTRPTVRCSSARRESRRTASTASRPSSAAPSPMHPDAAPSPG